MYYILNKVNAGFLFLPKHFLTEYRAAPGDKKCNNYISIAQSASPLSDGLERCNLDKLKHPSSSPTACREQNRQILCHDPPSSSILVVCRHYISHFVFINTTKFGNNITKSVHLFFASSGDKSLASLFPVCRLTR